VTSLFIYISYNIKAKSLCVCVCVCVSESLTLSLSLSLCVCVSVAAGEEIDIHNALADPMSLNDWVNFFASDGNDSNVEQF